MTALGIQLLNGGWTPMKRSSKKLTLSREPLRLLDETKDLQEVAGGKGHTIPTAPPNCFAVPSVASGC
jgi:hypothetical protein